MENKLEELKKKQDEEFKNTIFGKNGGWCFECCDYESMYDNLEKFIDKVRTETAEAVAREMVGQEYDEVAIEMAVSDLANERIGYNQRISEEQSKLEEILKSKE